MARLKTRLDATFGRCGRVADLETQSDLARYLCVLVSGYLEKAAAELVLEHARRTGGPTLQRYVEKTTKRFANVDAEKLKTLLGKFNGDWRDELDTFIVDDLRDAVNSIVGLRNSIAHGGSATVTYGRVVDYYNRVEKVIQKVADLCAP